MKQLFSIILGVGALYLALPSFAQGLRDAPWHTSPSTSSSSAESSTEAVNDLSVANRNAAALDAVLRQTIASVQNNLQRIKSELKEGGTLSQKDQEFLKEVVKQPALAAFMDKEIWELIAKRDSKGEAWAKDLLAMKPKGNSVELSQEVPIVNPSPGERTLSNAGLAVAADANGEPRIISTNNSVTRSVLKGFKGAYSNSNDLPSDNQIVPAEVGFFSSDGFNLVQLGDEYVPADEYEKKKWGRKLVMDPKASGVDDVSNNLIVPTTAPPANVGGEESNPFKKMMDSIASGGPFDPSALTDIMSRGSGGGGGFTSGPGPASASEDGVSGGSSDTNQSETQGGGSAAHR